MWMSAGERSTAWIDVSADAGVTYICIQATPAAASFEGGISGSVERTTAAIYPERHWRALKMSQIALLHKQRNFDVSTPIINSALIAALSDLRVIRPINIIPTSSAQVPIST
ncbi:hypothetical protein M422DRAFT_37119 [Sphaerobolus stellatus SS14]|uniref:Uncharacterized protein n=1 Tax=Sphaerobolus stellatus (strain SS14) TaxID=990650 RepID=A0A0C9THH6_SPHS4|nr:hypothetical protein M422DRAFT_37119 [Sphaerobolus stellatus SS14]